MGANPAQTEAKRLAFLAAYERCGHVRAAAKAAGIHVSTHYDWLKDEAYAEQFEQATQRSAALLEDFARRRATIGWNEPVFYEGTPCGKKRKFSDPLLMFLLKANNPKKFGDRVEQTHKGDAASPLVLFELPINGREAIQDE